MLLLAKKKKIFFVARKKFFFLARKKNIFFFCQQQQKNFFFLVCEKIKGMVEKKMLAACPCCMPPWQSQRAVAKLTYCQMVAKPPVYKAVNGTNIDDDTNIDKDIKEILKLKWTNETGIQTDDMEEGREELSKKFLKVLNVFKTSLQEEEIVKYVDTTNNVVVFGDIHGQYTTLLKWFEKVGWPKDTPNQTYIFLGDYIDRGKNSLMVMMTLLTLRHKYPTRVYLLRGNHEDHEVCSVYGFSQECDTVFKDKDKVVYMMFVKEIFMNLPMVLVLNKKYMCMHGGPCESMNLKQINKEEKVVFLSDNEQLGQIAWNDPNDRILYFERSARCGDDRDCEYKTYGVKAVERVLNRHNDLGLELRLDTILRAHQVYKSGLHVWTLPKPRTKWCDGGFLKLNVPNAREVCLSKCALPETRTCPENRSITNETMGCFLNWRAAVCEPEKKTETPRVMTIFSAECYENISNSGAILIIKGNGPDLKEVVDSSGNSVKTQKGGEEYFIFMPPDCTRNYDLPIADKVF